jgi:tRNA threonylcarbamoyl adenosine modification protein YeaZ
MSAPLLLAIDAASPRVSVAIGGSGRGGQVLAERAVEIERSSGRLVDLIGEVLAETGARPTDLGGVVALRGPGSFTGLRVGLATALGFHQALGVRATAISTLHVLSTLTDGLVVAAVDALRGEWSVQSFNPPGDMQLVPGGSIPGLLPGGEGTVVGFGVSRLAGPDWPEGVRLLEAGPLAGAAVRLAASLTSNRDLDWDPDLLVRPLYSRPPAITPARPRRSLT